MVFLSRIWKVRFGDRWLAAARQNIRARAVAPRLRGGLALPLSHLEPGP